MVVVLESVRYLGAALASTNVECVVTVGESREETRRAGTYKMNAEHFGPKVQNRLNDLFMVEGREVAALSSVKSSAAASSIRELERRAKHCAMRFV